METNTEHDLIIRCRKGDEQAWRLLLTRYEAYVYRLCFRISGSRDDALDLTRLRLLWLELGQDEKIEVPEILPFIRQQAVTRARAARQEIEGISGVGLWEAQKLAWQPFLAVTAAVGFGMGSGEGQDEKHGGGKGTGGGAGLKLSPSALLIIQGDNVQVYSLNQKGSLAKLVEMIPEVVNKLKLKENAEH